MSFHKPLGYAGDQTTIKAAIADGLHGSYDLIYSAGLFDYLNDRTVRAAGAQLAQALARAVRR